MRRKMIIAFSAACIAFMTAGAGAMDDVVLTVSGEGMEGLTLTEDDVRALPPVSFTTFDPWDNMDRSYTGVRMLDLLAALELGREVELVEVIARNDYRAKITLKEMADYGHILSYSMDGKDYELLLEEDKGPLAVAVDMSLVAEEDQLRVKGQLVWWVEQIVLY